MCKLVCVCVRVRACVIVHACVRQYLWHGAEHELVLLVHHEVVHPRRRGAAVRPLRAQHRRAAQARARRGGAAGRPCGHLRACVHVRARVCVRMSVCACECARVRACVRVRPHLDLDRDLGVLDLLYVLHLHLLRPDCLDLLLRVQKGGRLCVCARAWISACVWVRMSVCVCVCACV